MSDELNNVSPPDPPDASDGDNTAGAPANPPGSPDEGSPDQGPSTSDAGLFAYQAQTPGGGPMTGTLSAPGIETARQRLEGLGLRVLELKPKAKSPKRGMLRGDEITIFNEQLAQLTRSGIPIEQGLRLIAQDMKYGRMAATVRSVADSLEAGKTLREAFDMQRGRFPHWYGQLVEAGAKSGKLPEMLLNLGRHLELMHRLRRTIWQAAAYPILLLTTLAGVLVAIGIYIVPEFRQMMSDFDTELPALTQMIFWLSEWVPQGAIITVAAVFSLMIFWWQAQRSGWSQVLVEIFLLPLPLVGGVIRRNMIARWCDALSLGVHAGMDLPNAIELAGTAMGSPVLQRDGKRLIDSLSSIDDFNALSGAGTVLPAAVPAAIRLAEHEYDLGQTLDSLSEMYQKQAEMRLGGVKAALGPLLLVVVGGLVFFVVIGLMLPLVKLIEAIS